MSNAAITYLVVSCCAVFGLAAFTAWVLVPAWSAYSRPWEKAVATVMSLYVLAAMVGVGVLVGAGIVWFWDRLF